MICVEVAVCLDLVVGSSRRRRLDFLEVLQDGEDDEEGGREERHDLKTAYTLLTR